MAATRRSRRGTDISTNSPVWGGGSLAGGRGWLAGRVGPGGRAEGSVGLGGDNGGHHLAA